MLKENNKGFTLIELLGVITILALILIIVVPNAINSTKTKSTEISMLNNNIVLNAAKLYVKNNSSKFPKVNNTVSCISIKDDLISEDYFKEIKNIDNTYDKYYIKVDYSNDKYSYTLTSTCEAVPSTDTSSGSIACYMSKTKVSDSLEHYKFKGIKFEEFPTSSISEIYYGEEDCDEQAIKEAAIQYVKDNPEDYDVEDTRCITIQSLLSNNYLSLINKTKYQTKVVEVYYDNSWIANIVDSGECKVVRWKDPRLYDNLIPVVYVDESTSSKKYASSYDETKASDDYCPTKTDYSNAGHWEVADTSSDWYEYDDQKWANAILISSDKHSKYYNSDDSYKVGTEVDLDDAIGMYVWIPRYEYKLGSNEDDEIDINIITKKSTTVTSGYTIHPAFTYGEIQIPGFWVSKFINVGEKSLPELEGLPNTSNTISNMLNFSVKYLGTNVELVESHAMKLSEYSAIAYLAQSNYGKYGNDDYTGSNKKIYTNPTGYTGRSSGSSSATTASEELVYNDDNDTLITACSAENIGVTNISMTTNNSDYFSYAYFNNCGDTKTNCEDYAATLGLTSSDSIRYLTELANHESVMFYFRIQPDTTTKRSEIFYFDATYKYSFNIPEGAHAYIKWEFNNLAGMLGIFKIIKCSDKNSSKTYTYINTNNNKSIEYKACDGTIAYENVANWDLNTHTYLPSGDYDVVLNASNSATAYETYCPLNYPTYKSLTKRCCKSAFSTSCVDPYSNVSYYYKGESYFDGRFYKLEKYVESGTDDVNGIGASSTGNIYGVYDMGTSETVAAVSTNSSYDLATAKTKVGISSIDSKYYDVIDTVNNKCNDGNCNGYIYGESPFSISSISNTSDSPYISTFTNTSIYSLAASSSNNNLRMVLSPLK